MSVTPIKNYWLSPYKKTSSSENRNNGERFTFSQYDNNFIMDKNKDLGDKINKQKYNSRESTDILKVLDLKGVGKKE